MDLGIFELGAEGEQDPKGDAGLDLSAADFAPGAAEDELDEAAPKKKPTAAKGKPAAQQGDPDLMTRFEAQQRELAEVKGSLGSISKFMESLMAEPEADSGAKPAPKREAVKLSADQFADRLEKNGLDGSLLADLGAITQEQLESVLEARETKILGAIERMFNDRDKRQLKSAEWAAENRDLQVGTPLFKRTQEIFTELGGGDARGEVKSEILTRAVKYARMELSTARKIEAAKRANMISAQAPYSEHDVDSVDLEIGPEQAAVIRHFGKYGVSAADYRKERF